MSELAQILFQSAKGESKKLSDFDAKAFLVVNTASKCGLTPQYEGLEKIYQAYKEQGLIVIGFPANEFLAQEPGSDEEIQEFCSLNYNVSFPVMAKTVVKGESIHPFFEKLIHENAEYIKNSEPKFEKLLRDNGLLTGEAEDIKWNFEKFLLDANGKLVARFFPDIAPDDERVKVKIQEILEN